jgi:hypothetical protein
LEATAMKRLSSVAEIVFGPPIVYARCRKVLHLLISPCFRVAIFQEEINHAANCFVEIVDSVSREEENSFQTSEEHGHEAIAQHVRCGSSFQIDISFV